MLSPLDVPGLPRFDPVTFAWTAVPGAAWYGFEFTGPDRQFANPNGTGPDWVNGFGGAGGGLLFQTTGFTLVLGPFVPAGTYQVRVIAITPDFQLLGRFSDAITVTVPPVFADAPPPPDPTPPPDQPPDCKKKPHHGDDGCDG